MERITFEGLFCDIAQCVGEPGNTSDCLGGYCDQRRTWERLKEYEDTGLTPEQIVAKDSNVPSKWIPVTERFPEKSDGHVLVTDGDVIKISCRNALYKTKSEEIRCAQGYGAGMSVTHWMPLPEPPKEN